MIWLSGGEECYDCPKWGSRYINFWNECNGSQSFSPLRVSTWCPSKFFGCTIEHDNFLSPLSIDQCGWETANERHFFLASFFPLTSWSCIPDFTKVAASLSTAFNSSKLEWNESTFASFANASKACMEPALDQTFSLRMCWFCLPALRIEFWKISESIFILIA